MYAVLDVETTGGKYNEEGITEIAIYRFDGNEIVDQLISLVNPEKPIQPFVQKLTGINNAMLVQAPKFHELAKRIVEITDGCFIVAHNAEFDYRMIRNEFDRLGYKFTAQTIDTVRLAQKLLPNEPAYSLGKLVRSLGIPIADRHRASGDALATLKLFKYLLELDTERTVLQSVMKSERSNELEPRIFDLIQKCPSAVGLCFFHDYKGAIIHIAKSSNIRKRVNLLFIGTEEVNQFLRENTITISYERTGSELIAELKFLEFLETASLKFVKKPKRLQIISWTFEFVEDRFYHLITSKNVSTPAQYFGSLSEANRFIRPLLSDRNTKGQVLQINEKVVFEERGADLSVHALDQTKDMFHDVNFGNRDFLLIGKGRTYSERSFVRVNRNKILGFGFFELNFQISDLSKIEKNMVPLLHSPAKLLLIHKFLRRQKYAKIVDL